MFFNDVRVPAGNLLGEPGRGFAIMMEELPRERLTIASRALGESQRAFELTVDSVTEREPFGQRIIDFQNTKFTLADIKPSLAVGWAVHVHCHAKLARKRVGSGKRMVVSVELV